MDSRIDTSFSRNKVLNLFAIWQNHINISMTWFLHHFHVFTSSSAALTWTLAALLNSDSPLLFTTSHHLGCVLSILHKSLPNGTFGNAFIRMGLGTEYLFGTEQRLQQGLLEKDRSPQTDISCCHIYHPRAPSSCGAEHLARVPISTSKKKKKRKPEKKICQMPLAHGAGTLTNYHSHCHGYD